MKTSSASDALKAQHEYTLAKKRENFDYSITYGAAFVRGIRDLGYRSTPHAIDELVDNSKDAGAKNIAIAFGFGKSDAKPESIYVMDDGHGMEPEMIRLSTIWGGTHRENSRSGWGRYGYGLPSASVSVAKRFTVCSKTQDAESWYSVSIDLDDMADGKYTSGNGQIIVPEAVANELSAAIAKDFRKRINSNHGTIVVLEKLDRLDYKTASRLQTQLLQNLGLTYRNSLRACNIFVNDTQVEPIDPLFLMPEARYYDLDEDRAEPLPPMTIKVKPTENRPGGDVRVRYSYLPPTFQRANKASKNSNKSNMNDRFQIMAENNGIIVLRNGRQIDVVTPPWTTYNNYDRNCKIELDFDASLDEEFGVTTSKQQITLSERLWNILKENRIPKALEDMRARNKHARKEDEIAEPMTEDQKRPSEIAMEQAQSILNRKVKLESVEKEIASQRALDREIRRRAQESKVSIEIVEEAIKKEIEARPFRLQNEASPEGPFFRVEQVGGQLVVYLNTSHRFFTDLYAGPKSSAAVRAALEVMLFVIGGTELDATPDYAKFYRQERAEWSRRLEIALGELDDIAGLSAIDEEHEQLTT